MLIKKFKAGTMQEALKLVKAEFGLDAMILNSREERPKGIKGIFLKPFFEVTAAMAPPSKKAEVPVRPVEEVRSSTSTREEFRNSMLEPLAREIRQLKEKVETLYEKKDQVEKSTAALLPDMRAQECEGLLEPIPGQTGKQAQFESLLRHSEEVREPLAGLADEEPSATGTRKSVAESRAELLAFAEELRRNGIGTDVTETLMERILPFVGRRRKTESLRKGLKQALESLIDFAGEEKERGQRVIALVGPAGVGKTTTIAKLAAVAAESGKRVAVVTADSLKADAGRLLKKYSGKTEITVNTAATPQRLAKIMESHREKDMILVDTAGISPHDNEAMEGLQKMLSAFPRIEKHLCLSSTTRDMELDETVRRFERYSIDKLIFTRLDESRTFGSIINVLLRNNLPLSYLTSGQHVTGSLETATAGRLSELATGGRD
jgi:flagellar biosynthesis protein FlhF